MLVALGYYIRKRVAESATSFSIDVATSWERALRESATPSTRRVAMRTAIVMHPTHGSPFDILLRLVRFGLGGQAGDGRQYMSWIHERDFCRAIEWLLAEDDFRGPANLAAPNPVPNAELMRTLRKVCRMPLGLPATRWMLEVGAFFLGTETELIIKSRRVVPGRLLAAGFEFEFPHLRGALEDLCAKAPR